MKEKLVLLTLEKTLIYRQCHYMSFVWSLISQKIIFPGHKMWYCKSASFNKKKFSI